METFVVRLWSAGIGEEEGETLRGVVEHVSTGTSDRFRSVEELVSFLRSSVPTPGAPVTVDADQPGAP